MGITFTRAVEVEPGSVVRSTEYNLLARAVNDRVLSGVGDGAYRIVWSDYGLVGQFLQQDEQPVEGATIIQPFDIWFRELGLIKPTSGITWPGALPGEFRGINLNNPLGRFVYGVDPLKDEAGRLEPIVPFQGGSLEEAWTAAKFQRGGFDTSTGFGVAPAIQVGVAHHTISYPYVVSFLKTYGGFHPARAEVGNCEDEAEQPLVQIVFTPVSPNPKGLPVRTFTGFCPAGSTGAAGADHIAWIGYGRDAYLIYKWDELGSAVITETLSTRDYVEGPYSAGGRIAHGVGEQLGQTLNAFIKGFRGADVERPDYPAKWKIKNLAFDFQNFFKNQYYLAPSRGEQDGDDITLLYPQFGFDEDADAGALSTSPQDSYDIHQGFVLAGFFVQAVGLLEPVEIEIFDETDWKRPVILRPDDSHNAEYLLYLEGAEVKQRKKIQVRLKRDLKLDTDGQLVVELAELLAYKPSIDDAYVLIRLASTRGGDETGASSSMDTHGKYDPRVAKPIWDDYRRYGCIVNTKTTGLPIQFDELAPAHIGDNPVYEAARLFTISNVRLATRDNIRGYEVITEGGREKSVLYYKRDYLFQNLKDLDVFESIAPPREAIDSGKIIPTITYEVKGEEGTSLGYVDTDGTAKTFLPGETFTGRNGYLTYTSNGALPYQVDGIMSKAPPRGQSNRWCCFFSCNVYRESSDSENSSLFKPDSFDPAVRLHQRCQFYSSSLVARANADLRQHIAPEQAPVLFPEAPSGYNYARGMNAPDRNDPAGAHYKSCQIYEAPYEIESCTNVVVDGEDRVRIKLNRRLRHWDGTQPEYRTDENAIQGLLSGDCDLMTGDYAPQLNGGEPGFPPSDRPSGSCYCRLYMVRLIPEVFADIPENSVAQPTVDSRVLVDAFLQMDKYGRAMCEGFVDGTSSIALQRCQLEERESYLFDYTQENWFYDAFGQKFVPGLPFAVAGDHIKGYGPLPAQVMYAEIFNCYVNAFNLLTRARIELPFTFEWKTSSFVSRIAVAPDWPAPNNGCSSGTEKAVFTSKIAPAPGTLLTQDDEWQPAPIGLPASKAAFIAADCFDEAGTFALQTNEIRLAYRFILTDPLAYNALSSDLQALLHGGNVGFLGRIETTTVTIKAEQVSTSGEARECGVAGTEPGYFYQSGIGYKAVSVFTVNPGSCQIFTSGQVVAPAVPTSDYFVGRTSSMIAGGEVCSDAVSVQATLGFSGLNQSAFVAVPLV